MYFIYYFRMTGQAYRRVHKLHPHHTQPLHIKPVMSLPEPRVPRQGMGNILEAMRCGQGERVPGWHSTAPPHPKPTDTRGFEPPPSSPARASVRGQFASAWRGRSPPNWEGAQRGAWFGGGCRAQPHLLALLQVRGCQTGAVRRGQNLPCGHRRAPSVLAGTATAPSSAGRGAGFRAGSLPGLAHFLPAHFPQSPPVPVTQVCPIPVGKVATWEGGTALSSGCLPPAAPPTLLWDQGQPQQPPSRPPAAPHLAGRGLAQREGKRRGPR